MNVGKVVIMCVLIFRPSSHGPKENNAVDSQCPPNLLSSEAGKRKKTLSISGVH